MVRVPLPQEQLRSGVSSGFSPQRVVGPADFTGQQIERFGQGLLRVGAATTEIALQLQNDLDNARTKEADNRLAEIEQVATRDFMSRIGKDANPSARDEVINGLQERIDLLGQGLDNDVQRSMFEQVAQARLRRARDRIDSHSIAETRRWHMGESAVRRRTLAGEAIEAWFTEQEHRQELIDVEPGDPRARELLLRPFAFGPAVERALQEANAEADLRGWPEGSAQREALGLETTTAIHEGIIDRLLVEGRPSDAESHLSKIPKDQVDPHTRLELTAKVRRSAFAGRELGAITNNIRAVMTLLDDEYERLKDQQLHLKPETEESKRIDRRLLEIDEERGDLMHELQAWREMFRGSANLSEMTGSLRAEVSALNDESNRLDKEITELGGDPASAEVPDDDKMKPLYARKKEIAARINKLVKQIDQVRRDSQPGRMDAALLKTQTAKEQEQAWLGLIKQIAFTPTPLGTLNARREVFFRNHGLPETQSVYNRLNATIIVNAQELMKRGLTMEQATSQAMAVVLEGVRNGDADLMRYLRGN